MGGGPLFLRKRRPSRQGRGPSWGAAPQNEQIFICFARLSPRELCEAFPGAFQGGAAGFPAAPPLFR